MYNKGTYEGDIDEIKFVRIFNSDKENFKKYLDTFTNDPSNYWMVRVTTKQTSHLNEKKVFTRADCYLAEITDNSISDILDKNSLYLSEEILETKHIRYRKMPVYLLCAGAYVASDFALIHSYPGKMLKWGYFPNAGSGKAESEKKREISDDMYRAAVSDTRKLKLLWAGRLIDLKHPEFAVEAAKLLTERGYDFYLDIAGDGNRKDGLNKLIEKYGLSDRVRLLGGKTPTEVLELMHEADIFLFTSNYLEGWGAVVNEAMSEKCCVLASGEAGAVPFLIREGENGLTYPDGNFEEFVNKLIFLFENKKEIVRMALEGKKTIEKLWNPENASKEFIRFCREYFENGNPTPAKEGPMSAAEIIKPAGIARTRQEKNVLE